MLDWLVLVRVEIVEVLLEVSDLDGLHGDPHLLRTEVLRMSLDRLQHILGQFINNIPSPGELETQHSLDILWCRLQSWRLLELQLGLTEIQRIKTKIIEAPNVSRYVRIHCLYHDWSLPFDVDRRLKSGNLMLKCFNTDSL